MKVVTKHGKETWVSKGRTYMIDNEAHEIVSQFNTEIRGFYNYYSIANNASALGRSFGCIMKFSMYKTLAQKLNMSVRKVIERYRKDNLFAVPFVNKGGETKYMRDMPAKRIVKQPQVTICRTCSKRHR